MGSNQEINSRNRRSSAAYTHYPFGRVARGGAVNHWVHDQR